MRKWRETSKQFNAFDSMVPTSRYRIDRRNYTGNKVLYRYSIEIPEDKNIDNLDIFNITEHAEKLRYAYENIINLCNNTDFDTWIICVQGLEYSNKNRIIKTSIKIKTDDPNLLLLIKLSFYNL